MRGVVPRLVTRRLEVLLSHRIVCVLFVGFGARGAGALGQRSHLRRESPSRRVTGGARYLSLFSRVVSSGPRRVHGIGSNVFRVHAERGGVWRGVVRIRSYSALHSLNNLRRENKTRLHPQTHSTRSGGQIRRVTRVAIYRMPRPSGPVPRDASPSAMQREDSWDSSSRRTPRGVA